MNNHLVMYWKYQRLKWRAARAVRSFGERYAANALWALNHVAKEKGGHTADTIYALKTLAVKHWYQEGRAAAVERQLQELTCNRCAGMGADPYRDGPCVRCSGSGVWKSHYLYVFKLVIGGEIYQWHQPESMVDYPVDLFENELINYTPRSYPSSDDYDYEFGYCVVLEYLRQQGLEHLPELLTARKVARRIWHKSRVYLRLCAARAWVRNHLPRDPLHAEADEIPF